MNVSMHISIILQRYKKVLSTTFYDLVCLQSRVLATIGVTRGFGDHDLKAQCSSIPIKPFLTPEPEVLATF